MEWIGLILEILLLGIFLIWEGYNKKKGENFAMKEDSREINYESEKGKNLATKEDIAQITKEIESIKGNYNKSLELYKFELSRFFESSKIIIDLCNSLDNKLIHLIIECKENIDNDFLRNNRDYSNTLKSVYKLGRFFLVYRSRYESNCIFRRIPVQHFR
nr:MAG TPA: Protein of unknown function (DUF2730) [Caudoviricetes sp.]